ncbi:SRPBCC family protein [Bauldia sp.]|uniref:SRPBCC family protein n=1 Tax=Bauldia sp. TaxID=2575872 RepID=UPI003BAA598E
MAESDDDAIVKVVELQAPRARVWKALTDHKEFGHWFRVDLDQAFEVGGTSTGRMTYPGHEGAPWVVYIERMQPERLFTFRWYDSDDGSQQDDDQPALLVAFELEETPIGTRLTITESGFSALPHPRRIAVMRGNREGWDIQANNLARHLSA